LQQTGLASDIRVCSLSGDRAVFTGFFYRLSSRSFLPHTKISTSGANSRAYAFVACYPSFAHSSLFFLMSRVLGPRPHDASRTLDQLSVKETIIFPLLEANWGLLTKSHIFRTLHRTCTRRLFPSSELKQHTNFLDQTDYYDPLPSGPISQHNGDIPTFKARMTTWKKTGFTTIMIAQSYVLGKNHSIYFPKIRKKTSSTDRKLSFMRKLTTPFLLLLRRRLCRNLVHNLLVEILP